MVTKAERDRKNANAEFHNLMDRQRDHLRVGQERNDSTRVQLLYTAADAHGLDGVCTCCPRRPAGELSARQLAAAAARAAVAELDPARRPAPRVVDVELDELLDREPTRTEQLIAAARAAAERSAAEAGRRD